MKKIVVSIMIFSLVLGPAIVNALDVSIDNVESNDFDSKILKYMEHGHFPGLACGIVKNDTLVWSKGYGDADLNAFNNRNVTTDTVFPMGSISKSFAATAIMQLNESGRISLDENISRFLPFDFKNPKYPDVNISARMLLAHQSSLKMMNIFTSAYCQIVRKPLDWLQRYLKRKSSWFDYAPGEDVCYASVDINILGYVIEKITGMKYADYCKENIFIPLKMYNTSFYLSDYNKEMLVRQYVWLNFFYLRIPFIKVTEIYFPGGGLRSNINDLSHYLIMHTSGGSYDGVRILSEESVKEMHSAQYPDTPEGGVFHGLGWYMWEANDSKIRGGHHGSHLGTFGAMLMRYSDKVGVMSFFNQHSYIRLILQIDPPEKAEAGMAIVKALFEKAEEF